MYRKSRIFSTCLIALPGEGNFTLGVLGHENEWIN